MAGTLVYASFPLLIVSAQDLSPRASAAAAGMVMGLATGIAGGLYIGGRRRFGVARPEQPLPMPVDW